MKVIQVGIGGMGRAWIEAVLKSPDVEYVAFVEINDGVASQQVEKYGFDPAVIYKSLPEALSKHQVDGVINVTPPQFHREVSVQAMAAGVPVLSEKPLADTLQDAQTIVETSAETGVLHMVTQNYRYSVPALTLKQLLSSGQMGAIGGVSVEFFKGPHFGGFREEMPYPLIIDMSIHHFDMMRYFLDSDPISVYGRSWNPPWSWFGGDASASVSFRFANEVVVSYDATWCATGVETPWNGHWRFECEKGVVMLRDDKVYVQQWQGVDGFNNINGPVEEVMAVQPQRVAQDYLLHEFYEAVTNGTRPMTTCDDNLKSLAMVFAVVDSFNSGNVIALSATYGSTNKNLTP